MTLEKIALFLLDDFILIFLSESICTKNKKDSFSSINWEVIPICGDAEFEHDDDSDSLKFVLKELNNRLNKENKLAGIDISIVYSAKCLAWLQPAVHLLTNEYACKDIQVSKYKDLLENISTKKNDTNIDTCNAEWIKTYILPLTFTNERLKQNRQMMQEQETLFAQKQKEQEVKYSKQQKELVAKFEKSQKEQETKLAEQQKNIDTALNQAKALHNNETEELDTEKTKLLEELNNIRLKLATIQAPSLENLVSFLPAVFKDFWNIVPPAELTIIAGKIDTPNINSPYKSPSNQAVLTKKRQFVKLDEADQKQIISFCKQLRQQYTLTIHHEFKSVLEEIG